MPLTATKKILLLIFLFSLTAIALWLGEILLIKGWYGLKWLRGTLYSPFLSTLFVVAAFMTPFVIDRSVTKINGIVAFILLYVVGIFCYITAAILVTWPYRVFFMNASDLYLLAASGFLLFPFFALCYWFVIQKFILKTKKINIIYTMLLSLAVVPLSVLSIWICPGFGTGDGDIDAVKMGYPVFWMGMMLGLGGLIMKKNNYEL